MCNVCCVRILLHRLRAHILCVRTKTKVGFVLQRAMNDIGQCDNVYMVHDTHVLHTDALLKM